jgi:Arc/MetJ family transcription regulator
MRTNIDIDDELMAKAMAATNAGTKKAVVEQGLELLVSLKAQEELRQLRGSVVWRGHDDDWSTSDEEILAKRRLAMQSAAQNEACAGSPGLASQAASASR